MFCSCDLCGWRRPQNGFRHYLAFRRRGAHIFFDKLAGSSKSIVFFRVLSHMADTKTSRPKKKCISSQRCDIFFWFPDFDKRPCAPSQPAPPARLAHQASQPASQPGAPSQLGQPSPPGPPSQPDMCTKPAWRTKPAASVPSRLVRNLYTFR